MSKASALASSLLFPLSEDILPALLSFYGPMFALWSLSGALAARRFRSFAAGAKFAASVAFITFCVYDLLVILRVNLFLNELTGRADWQSMMQRFRVSGSDSLRGYVTMEYIQGAPFKIAVATAIGAVFGSAGALLGWLSIGEADWQEFEIQTRR